MSPSKDTVAVILCSTLIAVILLCATWGMNFWPTDTEDYYLPAAIQLPSLKYISEIHHSLDETRVRWLHGKEMTILCASLWQRLLNDFATLRPFLVIGILSVCLSSIMIFIIARAYWGAIAGWVCYTAFTASFWPYVYILFTKHQPQGLVFFLAAVLCVQLSSRRGGLIFYAGAGILLGCSFFASPVAGLFLPYWFAAFVHDQYRDYQLRKNIRQGIVRTIVCGSLFLSGFVLVFIYFTYPNIIQNIKGYFEYVDISKNYNQFYYNQPVLQQWFPPENLQSKRAGWLWVIKYFFLIMPVLFPVYLLSCLYLLKRCFSKASFGFRAAAFLAIALSLSSPGLAELKGVAQDGANYFTSLVGIIFLVGYAVAVFFKESGPWLTAPRSRTLATRLLILTAIAHITINAYVFASDVYPCRMATSFLSQKIRELGISRLYTYRDHPLRVNMVDGLDPDLLKKIQIVPIDHIYQPPDGYILVPPVTGTSLYKAMTSDYNDFDPDLFLNGIVKRGELGRYAAASYKTLASSRIWPNEQEILSYRQLVLGQPFPDNMEKSKVWLLDVRKLKEDFRKNLPDEDEIGLLRDSIRNIGTERRVLMFKGERKVMRSSGTLTSIPMRIYKVGDPRDSLVAYFYTTDKEQPVWIPLGKDFSSVPVPAGTITADPRGDVVEFQFPKSLAIIPGFYTVVVYRTGAPSDRDFYRINTKSASQPE